MIGAGDEISEHSLRRRKQVMPDYRQISDSYSNRKEDSIARRPPEQWLMPGTYDGTTALTLFLNEMETCAQYNHWDEEDKLAHLKVRLKGSVALMLNTDAQESQSFDGLVARLEQRYGAQAQAAVYRARLRNRRRRMGESLRDLCNDINSYMSLGYPSHLRESLELIAVEAFIHALNDDALEARLWDRGPQTLDEVYGYAEIAEAHTRGRKINHESADAFFQTEMRSTRPDDSSDVKQDELRWEDQSRTTSSAPPFQRSHAPRFNRPRRGLTCYNCDEPGHISRDCTQPQRQRYRRAGIVRDCVEGNRE